MLAATLGGGGGGGVCSTKFNTGNLSPGPKPYPFGLLSSFPFYVQKRQPFYVSPI